MLALEYQQSTFIATAFFIYSTTYPQEERAHLTVVNVAMKYRLTMSSRHFYQRSSSYIYPIYPQGI
jgi:hypothetical protein